MSRIKELVRNKYFGLAREATIRALEDSPGSIPLRGMLIEIFMELRDFQEAYRIITELLEEVPDNDELFGMYPQILLGAGRPDEAVERAIELRERVGEENPNAIGLLAEILETTSKLDELRELIDGMKPSDPLGTIVQALGRARIAMRGKDYEEAVRLFEGVHDSLEEFSGMDETIRVKRQVDCCFQISKAYDRMGEFDKAWDAATRAHREQDARSRPIDWSAYADTLDSVRRLMDRETLASLARCTEHLEYEPLYIVGNPRSGTSLLEQILSMHPKVANGGEMSIGLRLQEQLVELTDSFHGWPDSILDMRADDAAKLGRRYMDTLEHFSAGKAVVSNKALNLQAQLGFLSLVTPNARGIMLYRYPLDNCVSCYTTNLLTSGHRYCSDLEDMAKVWIARRKIMEHWQDQIEMPLLELHYESMVQNQEHETKRIIEFLGLEWDDACLEFYKSKFVARTISYDQVNRKMYTTSDGRWKNYEKHLGPFIERVGDYL